MSAPLTVLDAGIAFDDDGVAYPTVVLDVRARPDVADLARVHAVEGIGDLATSVAVIEDGLLLDVVLTRPVSAAFSILLFLPEHLPVLQHAAVAGHLLLATSTPVPDGVNPPWLAIDLDGPRLAALLAAVGENGDPGRGGIDPDGPDGPDGPARQR